MLSRVRESANELIKPYWYVLGVGLAFIAVGFVFASQRLVVYSRAFLLEAAVYILLQVAGWVLVIEWLRITGYLTVRADGEH